jgi:hypothetical protein
MLTDGVAERVGQGTVADGSVEVLDIAEVLARGRALPLAAHDATAGEQ